MDIIALMFVALTASFLLGELFYKLKMPKILGPIIIGLIFAQDPFISIFNTGNTFEIFDFIKDIGIIFLLFFVGLKIDIKDFKKTSKKSFFVGIFASLIPFLLGFFSVLLLNYFELFGFFLNLTDNIFLVAFVTGICVSVTAEEVIIELLEELGIINSVIGETILEAGVIDDFIGIILIGILVAFMPHTGSEIAGQGLVSIILLKKLLDMLLFAGIIFIIGYFVVPRIMKVLENKKSNVNFFSVSLMIALFLAMLTKYFDLGGSIMGALFGGIIIRQTLLSGDKYEQKEEKYITDIIEIMTFGFFAPFFFMWIGLNVNLSILYEAPMFALFFVLLALGGKMFGSMIGNRLTHGKFREGMIIGWGMNTRSGVDIMIATLALTTGIISINLFSLLVFMSFVTTVISPVMFGKLIRRYHGL